MWTNSHSYSNPIYDIIDQTNVSFTRPLIIDIQPTCPPPSSSSSSCTNQIPLLLLANCLPTPPPINNQHNYVNQRINDEENLDPLYAKPRKRCVTLQDEPIIIPPKTSRFSIEPQRAQLISTKLPPVTIHSTIEPIDEIDQFIARENDRVERVKLRRRQNKIIDKPKQLDKPPPAFSNPNYVDIPIINDNEEKKLLSKSILV